LKSRLVIDRLRSDHSVASRRAVRARAGRRSHGGV